METRFNEFRKFELCHVHQCTVLNRHKVKSEHNGDVAVARDSLH